MKSISRRWPRFCLAGLVCLTARFAVADPEGSSGRTPDTSKPGLSSQAGNAQPAATVRKKVPNANVNANKAAAKNVEITIERELKALAFATQQHPELAALITPLKASNPKEYQRAIRELYRTSERLEGIRTKDSTRYELELEAWKIQSQVRLLAARLSMSPDPELEIQLKDTLKKKSEIQLELLQNERATLQARLAAVQKQIDKSEHAQGQSIEQEYDRLIKQSRRNKTSVVPKANPGKPVGKKAGVVKPAATPPVTDK